MPAKIIDGRALATRLRAKLRQQATLLSDAGHVPGLAVILVGADPASRLYVKNKLRACEECGVRSRKVEFGIDVSESEITNLINGLNADSSIHGILVQLPLPQQIDVRRVIGAISVNKDVDGFHLYNVGALTVGQSIFPPCTPYGVQVLLDASNIQVEGKHVVVVGASNIVGKPMALMLLQRNATVTVCHLKTANLEHHTRSADILIVAAGRPNLIQSDMVKPGVVVIDVGINKLSDGRIVGDVDFAGVAQMASSITPVPGGVGPMTVTMLILNTIRSAQRFLDAGVAVPDDSFWDTSARCNIL